MVLRKVPFVTCIREVSGWNRGRDTDCADREFRGSVFCVKVIGLQSFNDK